jgi:hypothetical protein
MSPFIVGLLAGLGAAAWVYDRTMRRTGGNTSNSIVIAVIAGIFTFVIVLSILSLIDSFLGK